MKLNVFIIKGKTLIFVFFSLLTITFVSLLLFRKTSYTSNEAIPTMAKPQFEEYFKNDLNGDGKSDLLYITCKNDAYYMESHIDNTTCFFNTKGSLNTLGNYSFTWPLSVKFKDINNDSIPEIITQGSFNEESVSHIFLWDVNEFKDILSSKANFIGVFNSSNTKNPVIMLSSISDSSTNLYAIEDTKLIELSLDNASSLILDTIKIFIKNIESPNDLSDLELFSSNISQDEKSNFYSLKDANYKYTFQDCFLEDITPANTDSDEYVATLNFKKYLNDDLEQVNLNISLVKMNNNIKITSFKINS